VIPLPILRESLAIMAAQPQLELIWASPRELLNVFQADEIGCHIITVTNDILAKLALVGKDLSEYSLDTVKMVSPRRERIGVHGLRVSGATRAVRLGQPAAR